MKKTTIPVMKAIMAGTILTVRQALSDAFSSSSKISLKSGNRKLKGSRNRQQISLSKLRHGNRIFTYRSQLLKIVAYLPITSCVTPAPRFPHPPTSALAVPTTSFANRTDVQYWHMTKVPPATPIKALRTYNCVAVCTKPVQAVGIDAKHRTTLKSTRAPYLSHRGPNRKRTAIVLPTPAIEDVQICFLLNPKSERISLSRGEIANQIKKAIKKENQEQWNPLCKVGMFREVTGYVRECVS